MGRHPSAAPVPANTSLPAWVFLDRAPTWPARVPERRLPPGAMLLVPVLFSQWMAMADLPSPPAITSCIPTTSPSLASPTFILPAHGLTLTLTMGNLATLARRRHKLPCFL